LQKKIALSEYVVPKDATPSACAPKGAGYVQNHRSKLNYDKASPLGAQAEGENDDTNFRRVKIDTLNNRN